MKLFYLMAMCLLCVGGSAYSDDSEMSKEAIVSLSSSNFGSLTGSGKRFIVDAYASWCGPCKQFAKVFDAASGKYGSKITFTKLNTDNEVDLANKLNIKSLPTIIYFKNGKEVGRHTGFMNQKKFEEEIAKYLGPV